MVQTPLAQEKYEGHWSQVRGWQWPSLVQVSVAGHDSSPAHGTVQLVPAGPNKLTRHTCSLAHCVSAVHGATPASTQPTPPSSGE